MLRLALCEVDRHLARVLGCFWPGMLVNARVSLEGTSRNLISVRGEPVEPQSDSKKSTTYINALRQAQGERWVIRSSLERTRNTGWRSGTVSEPAPSRRVKTGVPMRVAEQRRSDRGLPRGLSEGEHNRNPLYRCQFEPEFRSGLSFRVAQGTPQGRRTWGRLSLLTFFGEAKKVSCRRATPGIRFEQNEKADSSLRSE